MMHEPWEEDLMRPALEALNKGFEHLPDLGAPQDRGRWAEVLTETARQLGDNDPYHHAYYIGQMLKPPHPVARLAYGLAQRINPNNHALDGGRASSRMEKEVVHATAQLFGWSESLGHLTSGGTMANFEALWVSRQLNPGRAIAASSEAHYTHSRLSAVLQVPFVTIATDAAGRMDLNDLRRQLEAGNIGTVVATLGTTALGAVDPLPQIIELREAFDFQLHIDMAYGGYFTLASHLGASERAAFDAIAAVDSIVVDPHKHGLQPYGCGCVLFRDPSVGRFYQHDSPYTYFSSDELHLGEISLECSRAGAAAVALWATWKLLPYERGGEFAAMLDSGLEAARQLHDFLCAASFAAPLGPPALDIVVWCVPSRTASAASAAARAIFEAAKERDLHLALATLPRAVVEGSGGIEVWDQPKMACLRACVMKPEHRDALPAIQRLLSEAAEEVLKAR